MAKNLIVGQSGGPTSVINSSLAGVIEYALASGKINKIYGMLNGIEGLLSNKIIALDDLFKNKPHRLNRLKLTPAMYLGSCRFRLTSHCQMQQIANILIKNNIGYFVYIGGNDSMDTVKQLAEYFKAHNIDIKAVGVPKTIDNDLFGIDHSPGFGSAAKYVATAVKGVAYDTSIYNIKSVHIIETMGRNAGWLAASSVLARENGFTSPHLIYLPEVPFSVEKFVSDVKQKLEIYNSLIVVVSEGLKDKNGQYISTQGDTVDAFGHYVLSGVANYLRSVLQQNIGCKVKALELSVLQRSSGHLSSQTDIDEAFNLGIVATKAALNGESGVFASLERVSDKPYDVNYSTKDIAIVANNEKTVPLSWITADGNDVTDDMVQYLKPLTQGVVHMHYRGGIPDYINITHLDKSPQKYVE